MRRIATTLETSFPTLLEWCVGSFMCHIELINMESICEMIFSHYLRRLNCIRMPLQRPHFLLSNFETLSDDPAGVELTTFRMTARCSTNCTTGAQSEPSVHVIIKHTVLSSTLVLHLLNFWFSQPVLINGTKCPTLSQHVLVIRQCNLMKSIVFKNIKDMTLRPNPDWKFFLVLIFYRQSIWLLKRAKLINTLCLLSSHSLSTKKVKSTSLMYIKHASFPLFLIKRTNYVFGISKQVLPAQWMACLV